MITLESSSHINKTYTMRHRRCRLLWHSFFLYYVSCYDERCNSPF